MDSLNRMTRPIVTGAPAVAPSAEPQQQQQTAVEGPSFVSMLQQQLESGSNTAFSKHAVNRVVERQIDVSDTNLTRLNEGMQLAKQKGLREALILIDQSAYIVNASQSKVITVDGEAIKGSVFTNIDGTVIV